MNTHNILFFNVKRENHANFPKSAAMGFFPRDSRTCSKWPSRVNEPSEPLKFYCN